RELCQRVCGSGSGGGCGASWRKRKFSAGVYAGHTEAARAYAGRDLWKTGGYRRLSALLRGRIRRNGGFGHRFCSDRCGFQGVFLAVCPSERPFCAHRGAVRGGGRRIRQERLGSQEAIRKGEWIEWKI